MQVLHGHRTRLFFPNTERTWPLEARAASFVLEAAGSLDVGSMERRLLPRPQCRVIATIVPADEPSLIAQTIIYTRDVSPSHLGFICHEPPPTNPRVQLYLSIDGIGALQVAGLIVRCRRFMEGWYEGVLRFDQPQPLLDSPC